MWAEIHLDNLHIYAQKGQNLDYVIFEWFLLSTGFDLKVLLMIETIFVLISITVVCD